MPPAASSPPLFRSQGSLQSQDETEEETESIYRRREKRSIDNREADDNRSLLSKRGKHAASTNSSDHGGGGGGRSIEHAAEIACEGSRSNKMTDENWQNVAPGTSSLTPVVRNEGANENFDGEAESNENEAEKPKASDLAFHGTTVPKKEVQKEFRFFSFHVKMLRSLYSDSGSLDECGLKARGARPISEDKSLIPLQDLWESVDQYLVQRASVQKMCKSAKQRQSFFEEAVTFMEDDANGTLKTSLSPEQMAEGEGAWPVASPAMMAPNSGASCCGNTVSTLGTSASAAMVSRASAFRHGYAPSIRQPQYLNSTQYSPSPFKARAPSSYQSPFLATTPRPEASESSPPHPLGLVAAVLKRKACLAQKDARARTTPFQPLVVTVRHRLARLDVVSKALTKYNGPPLAGKRASGRRLVPGRRVRPQDELSNQISAKTRLWRLLLADLELVVNETTLASSSLPPGGKSIPRDTSSAH